MVLFNIRMISLCSRCHNHLRKLIISDQVGDWPEVRLPAVLGAARLPALRGEEADQQREQGPGDRLQRLQAHLMRLNIPGDIT